MTINNPTVENGNLKFVLSSVNTALEAWYMFKTSDVVGITGSDPETITNYGDTYLPLSVVASTTALFECNDLPYISGDLTLFLKDADGWTRHDYTLTNTKRTTGVNFPVTIQPAAEKQPTPIADSNDIKGAPKYYSSFQDFLYIPREHLTPNMIVNVYDEETTTIKQFVLDRNGVDIGNGTFGPLSVAEIATLKLPFLKADITNSRSYLRFFSLLSESTKVNPVGGVIRYYAPDYEDGLPPLYDNLLDTGTPGVTYPVGLSVPSSDTYKKNREFLGTWSWDAPTSQFINADAGTTEYFPKKQVTKNIKPGDKWFIETVDGINFSRWKRIGQYDQGSVLQNRYIRRVTDVLDPYGTLGGGEDKFPATPSTFYGGVRNRFGRYEEDFLQGGSPSVLQYFDTPPAERLNRAGLSPAEQSMYDDFITDGVSTLDVDGLWETTCIKDRYNRLESEFSTARYIPKNGDLVRYSASDSPDINELDPADYTANGWVESYIPGTHRYKAERESALEDFQIVLIADEIGTYTARVYKAYPLRYFDRLTNAATAPNYAPTGIAAAINPSDDVDSGFIYLDTQDQATSAPNAGKWSDSWFRPPIGWNLWVSEATFYFGGDKLKTAWSNPTLFDADAAVIDTISGQEDFKSTPSVDDQGNSTVTYEPDTIDLTANLAIYAQRSTDEGQQYILNDDSNETIKYKWERIFNNGAVDATIIFDNTSTADDSELISAGDLVGGAATYNDGSNDLYGVSDSGRTLHVYPDGLDKRAIYKVTQERTIPGGTVTYTEETRGLLDVADGLASKVIVVTSDRPYFVLKGDAVASGGVFAATDYTNPDGANHPVINLRAFVQNVAEGKWYRWSFAGTFDDNPAQESSISPTYWTEVSSNKVAQIAADSAGWNNDTVNQTVVYKYQSGSFYDILRIERIQEGASIRDLDIRASALVVSYDDTETDFDPTGQILEFRAVAQNLSTAGINWQILDKDGLDVSSTVMLYDQSSGGNPVSDGDTVGYLRAADYPTGNPKFDALKAAMPFTVRLTHDDYADQVDFATVRKVKGASEGPEGPGAIVGYLTNEAENQACNEAGVPIDATFATVNGSLDIRTQMEVYQGITPDTESYQFDWNNITAVDENGAALTKGVEYDYEQVNLREIKVIQIPEGSQKLIISLPIQRIVDEQIIVTRKFTITKSLAGFTNLRVSLSNELVTGKYKPDNTIIDSTSAGLTGYGLIGEVKVSGFLGKDLQNITFLGNTDDSIIRYDADTKTAFSNSWTGLTFPGETTLRHIRYNQDGNDIYFVLGDTGTIYIVSKLDTKGPDFDFTVAFQNSTQLDYKKIAIRWFEQASDQYAVVLKTDKPSFSANESNTFALVSARIVGPDGVETGTLPVYDPAWSIKFYDSSNQLFGTPATTEVGYTATIKVTRAQVSISRQIIAKLLDGANNVVAVGTIVLYDLKDAPSFQTLFYASDTVTIGNVPTPSGVYNDFPESIDGQWGKAPDVDRKYHYVSRKSEYQTNWSNPIQIKGEQGNQGDLVVRVRVYKVSDFEPTISGGNVPEDNAAFSTFTAPAGWSKTPQYTGFQKLWGAERQMRRDPQGAWSWDSGWDVFVIGAEESLREVYVYRGSVTATPGFEDSYDDPNIEYPQASGNWSNSMRDITDDYIWRSRGLYAGGALRKRIPNDGLIGSEVNLYAAQFDTDQFLDNNDNVITTGNAGDFYFFNDILYEKTDAGSHLWEEALSYYWDKPELVYINRKGDQGIQGLQGDQGIQGIQGEQGDPAEAGPGLISPTAARQYWSTNAQSPYYQWKIGIKGPTLSALLQAWESGGDGQRTIPAQYTGAMITFSFEFVTGRAPNSLQDQNYASQSITEVHIEDNNSQAQSLFVRDQYDKRAFVGRATTSGTFFLSQQELETWNTKVMSLYYMDEGEDDAVDIERVRIFVTLV